MGAVFSIFYKRFLLTSILDKNWRLYDRFETSTLVGRPNIIFYEICLYNILVSPTVFDKD